MGILPKMKYMGLHARFWYLFHQRAGKARTSLCIYTQSCQSFHFSQNLEVEDDPDQKLDSSPAGMSEWMFVGFFAYM